MIPLLLSVKNFLCYREGVPELDFTGIHVACLCGPNGHGKSALLDAITWCLWGKARGKTQDELISYGADECSVRLDFLCRETRFRVVRTHGRSGGKRRQGVTDLQFQVMSASGPQPITGNHIRETQAKIDQTVGMDYDTFTNSAFLLQGRADEFTNKIPSERKAVLAKILGLELYDRLQVRAKERLAENLQSSKESRGALDEMQRQMDAIGDPSAQLSVVDQQLVRLEHQLEQSLLESAELKSKVADLERRLSQLEGLDADIATLRDEIEQLKSALDFAQARIRELETLIGQGETVLQGANELEKARRRFEFLEEARQSYDKLAVAKSELVRTIDRSRTRLEAQAAQLRPKVEVELPAKAGAETELLSQQDLARNRLEAVARSERELVDQREGHRTLATRIGEAQSVAERYKVEGQELLAKLELLQRTGHLEAMCPLCRTALGEDGCLRLAETYDVDIVEKRRLYSLNDRQLKQLEKERDASELELGRREQAAIKSRREEESKLAGLELGIKEAQMARQELDQLGPQLSEILTALESGDFAREEQAQLSQLDIRMESLGYNENARRESYVRVQELQPFAETVRQLASAEASLPREKAASEQTMDMLIRRRAELDRLDDQQLASKDAVLSLPQWRTKLEDAEKTQRALQDARRELAENRGRLVDQVQRLERLNQEMAKVSARLSDLLEDQGVNQELVTAFGRQGVQAMLIETVVPRIEEEANALLGRMTDNRMHVTLETQRERRTGRGEPIETLEIWVADELGPRSYEMYSGGEAFRVNLALRIALSKVLAQRMGSPLPTLFIDEGFGTQDAAGRERILDVISSIQDDFEKIIVITHLDELKDAFPVRIEVQKTGDGSTFWLS